MSIFPTESVELRMANENGSETLAIWKYIPTTITYSKDDWVIWKAKYYRILRVVHRGDSSRILMIASINDD